MRLILLAVTLYLAHAEVPQLPSYFRVCARFDPNFGDCVVNSSREVIPHIVKGEIMFNLPPLDPFEIKELKLSHGQGRGQLNMTLRDVKLLGLKDAYLLNYLHDLNKKNHSSFLLTVPQLKVLGTYILSGQILLLPIRGTGNINITLVHTKCMVRNTITVKKINGRDHFLLTSATVHLDPERMYIYLDNLFNGDKRLGDEMNKLLDENWKEVFDEITPHIAASFLDVLRELTNAISKQFPIDILMPETMP
ncbi:protein takeout-like [Periplaneta americana]|uniref:protein takeout-like n=1 Tax=Periplaneta americana TaxID=6978 RepID=UPI0037E90500